MGAAIVILLALDTALSGYLLSRMRHLASRIHELESAERHERRSMRKNEAEDTDDGR